MKAFFPWTVWREVIYAQPGVIFVDPKKVAAGEKVDRVYLWGNEEGGYNAWAKEIAARDGAEIVLAEDGFIKSADTWANSAAPLRYRRGCSVIFDRKGYYFDGTRTNELEEMLESDAVEISAAERDEARRIMARIVREKITKYNHQSRTARSYGRAGRRKVLVVDQSFGDASIRLGCADEGTFLRMLEDAKRENPDADILVKTHPDTLTGTRKGYYSGLKEEDNVFRVTDAINPYVLLEEVDTVYVCTTQLGFEALMAGKRVKVYGMPFYAGWGVTEDAIACPRRTRKRSLEELFAIFYLRYTKWVDPVRQCVCTIDESIDRIIKLRSEYRWAKKVFWIRRAVGHVLHK